MEIKAKAMTSEQQQELFDSFWDRYGLTYEDEAGIALLNSNIDEIEEIILKSKIKEINSLRLSEKEQDEKSPDYIRVFHDTLDKVIELLKSA